MSFLFKQLTEMQFCTAFLPNEYAFVPRFNRTAAVVFSIQTYKKFFTLAVAFADIQFHQLLPESFILWEPIKSKQ